MRKWIFTAAAVLTMAAFMLPSAARAEVVEQYTNLTPGNTYYFDLSSEASSVGTIYTSLPDTSLHYVPFTYAGTIGAYVLDSSSSGNTSASTNANPIEHSLFIAQNNIGKSVSWDTLNGRNLIFGKALGDGLTLRVATGGSGHTGSGHSIADDRGTPYTNEWDKILDKNAGYISPDTAGNRSWVQDTDVDAAANRILRGGGDGGMRYRHTDSSSGNSEYRAWRPAVVINSGVSNASVKTITLKLNGGSFNSNNGDLKIVCAGTTYTAPNATVLARPSGNTGTYFVWNTKEDGTGTDYAAGASVPSTVTTLYAKWKEVINYTMDFTATSASWGGMSGVDLTTTDKSGTNWTWTASSKTLALSNFSFITTAADAIKLPSGATLTLSGSSTVQATASNGSGIVGIGALSINGSGTLNVTGTDCGMKNAGVLSIESVTINANGTTGISSTGSMSISSGTVNANGASTGTAHGISAQSITVSGGRVTAKGNTCAMSVVPTYSSYTDCVTEASTAYDGTDASTYNSGSNSSYKHVCIRPNTVEHTYGDFTVSADDEADFAALSFSGSELVFGSGAAGKSYTIKGTTTANRIKLNNIPSNNPVNITLDGVNIDASSQYNSPFNLDWSAAVNLFLAAGSENTLKSASRYAGIQVLGAASITIDSDSTDSGSISVYGNDFSAAIGETRYNDAGSITINGGTVNAFGGQGQWYPYGAGIGSGGGDSGGNGGVITINGGVVNATSNGSGAAIGGGGASGSSEGKQSGRIIITGGEVNALNTARYGTAIGCGSAMNYPNGALLQVGAITITGSAKVTAVAANGGKAIGGCSAEYTNSITIDETATVFAMSNESLDKTISTGVLVSNGNRQLLQISYNDWLAGGTKTEIRDENGAVLQPEITATPTGGYKYITVTLPSAGNYTVYKDGYRQCAWDNNASNVFYVPAGGATGITRVKPITYNVTLPSSQTGYTLAAKQGSSSPVKYGEDYTFTFNLQERYKLSYISVNGTNLTLPLTNGEYTISSIAADQTIAAAVEIIKYAITYDRGSSDRGWVPGDQKTYGVPYSVYYTTLYKTGYTQVGWKQTAESLDGTGAITTLSENEATTLYPVWELNTYDVTYNNGASSTTTQSFDHGDSYTLNYNDGSTDNQSVTVTDEHTISKPTRKGYNFMGWSYAADSKTFTAQWELITYTITYYLNDGTATGSNPTTYDVTTETFTISNPTKVNHTFKYWIDYDSWRYYKTVTLPKGSTGNRIFGASWIKIQVTVNYDANGKNNMTPVTLER